MARPADEPILKEGQNFCGYVVVTELGRGGFGAVYLAEDHKFDRKVALKILLSDRGKDPKIRARFEREALAATRIDHPAIVNMLDKGAAPDGTLYLVMEFIEGEPLNKYIKTARERGVQIEPVVAYSVVLQIARALVLAHSKGIFHRDLKPQNIMLVPDETVVGGVRVKILDFGIAKLLPRSLEADEEAGPTSTGEMQPGTYAYMPPEQYRSYQGITGLEGFMDVYALGVMLYQLLAGRLPLFDANAAVMMGLAAFGEPTPLHEIDPTLPKAVTELVHAMLAKEAKARPTMAQVKEKMAAQIGLASQAPDVFRVRPTGEHQMMMAQLSTGQLEAELAPTPDISTPGPAAAPASSSASPSSKVVKSVGDRSTRPSELSASDAALSSARGTGQQLTGPETKTRRRRLRAVLIGGGGLLGVVVLALIGAKTLRHSDPPAPRAHVTITAPQTPTTSASAPPTPDAPVVTQPPPPAVTPDPPTSEPVPVAPTRPTKAKSACTPVAATAACISGGISDADKSAFLSALDQAEILLCPNDSITVVGRPTLEVTAASGVRKNKQQRFEMALRGAPKKITFSGEVMIRCRRR